MRVEFSVESRVSDSLRARQVSSMFDAPPQEKCRIEWSLNVDLESEPWNVGLVVGPSGSGKSSFMRHLWGEPRTLEWNGLGVVDDFVKGTTLEQIAAVCQAVGFNTIPAWMRPYAVLSNGEKFRVELARRMLEDGDPVVVDEFTSVVDRQVAQIGSHAVQRYCRKEGKRFVAVTCHYDVIDWLQPDWVLDMATRQFTRRLLQRRPTIDCVVGRLPRSAWTLFAPYHYMSAELHPAAKCYGLWANGSLASFVALLHQPISSGGERVPIWRTQRGVTLPDWQGLGLVMVLIDALGAEYKADGKRVHSSPAHPMFVRSFDKSPNWKMTKKPGFVNRTQHKPGSTMTGNFGGRPCAMFEYVGQAAEKVTLL